MELETMIQELETPETAAQLARLYGNDPETVAKQKARYGAMIRQHRKLFGDRGKIALISAPGRTEIGGNHTDHNHGRVLAAAVNLDTLCAVTPRNDMTVQFHSHGYSPIEISLDDLSVHDDEKGTTMALIRGVAAGMKEAGYRIGGFDAVVTSTVAGGSGLEQLRGAGSDADGGVGRAVQPV